MVMAISTLHAASHLGGSRLARKFDRKCVGVLIISARHIHGDRISDGYTSRQSGAISRLTPMDFAPMRGSDRSHNFDGRGQHGGQRGGPHRGAIGDLLKPQTFDASNPILKEFYVEHPDVKCLSEEEVAAALNSLDARIEGKLPHPKPVQSFGHIGLSKEMLKPVLAAGFPGPSPIQSIGWPTALSGRDMVAVAQTGSGKTLGFALPALVHIAAQAPVHPGDGPVALVLAPTRELAMQIQAEVGRFTRGSRLRCVAVFGGASRHSQISELRQGVEMIVATPGRLIDLLESRETSLKRCSYLVLDEADRMLDMGFEPQIRKIVSQIRPDRQTLLWSATWPKEIQRMANDFCRQNPVKVTIGSDELTANPNITQLIEVVDKRDKNAVFIDFMQKVAVNGERVLVFCETKRACDSLVNDLTGHRFNADAIHGNKDQKQRDRIMGMFKSGRTPILVATDVAQRGLDVKELNYVVNYDIPKNLEDYIHRIGRTARAGAKGTALTLFPKSSTADSKKNAEVANLARGIMQAMKEVGQSPPEAMNGLTDRRRTFLAEAGRR